MNHNDGRRARRANPLIYYIASVWRVNVLPRWVRRVQRRLCLRGWQRRADADMIRDRVAFYCQLPATAQLPAQPEDRQHFVTSVKDYRRRPDKDGPRMKSRYYYDFGRWLRGFKGSDRLAVYCGDTLANPSVPTLMKARRLDDKTSNSVLLNVNRMRHFMRVKDTVPFASKQPVLFFRGAVTGKPGRIRFFERYAGTPGFDLGDTARDTDGRWAAPEVSVQDHFDYQYILCLEGNDVASALQWVMASNCVPVMTRPTCEGWLMHSRLVPGVHYVEISPDFSDVAEVMAHYIAHPEEGARIAEASRRWAEQFADPRREAIISYLVAERYLRSVNGLT